MADEITRQDACREFERPAGERPDDRLSRWLGSRAVWYVFGVALVVRLIFFVVVKQPTVQFDASRYVGAGLAFPLALTNPSLLSDSAARSEIRFDLLFNDLIADERANWWASNPPTFEKSLDDIFFAGPVYPAFLGAVFRLIPRYDFWFVRILQAIIDSLTAVLIWRIARRLVSPAAGWWAAGIWAVYGAAIFKCGELNTETAAIALATFLVWALIRAYDDPRRGRLWLVGVLGAVLVLTKASTALLFPVLLCAWFWVKRRHFRQALAHTAIMGIAFALVMAPWLLAVWLRYQTWSLRDPAYAGANLRSSNILESEGYDLHLTPPDFWTYPVWRGIRNHPLDYAKLYLRKFYRMWGRASDEYRLGFPFGLTGEQWVHRIVVVLALFGLLLWPVRAGPVALIPLALIAYFAGLHMVMHVVSRYNLVAMPLVAIGAALGGEWLLSAGGKKIGPIKRAAVAAAVMAAVCAGIAVLRPTAWLAVGSLFSWESATWAFWISGSLLIIGGVFVFAWLSGQRGILYRAIIAAALTVFLLVFWTQAIPREGHADWSVRLDRPGKVARQTIAFPDWLVRDSIEAAFAEIDMVVDARKNCTVTISVGNLTQRIPADSLIDVQYFYKKPSYSVFSKAYGDRLCDIRQWVVLPLDDAIIDSILAHREITVSLSVEPYGASPGGVTLYGDLPVRDYKHWIGPSFTLGSIERYYEGDDPRIWAEEPLDFKTAASEIVIDGTTHKDDLSDRWGRQIGQYRMVISIVKPCGVFVNF